MISSSSGMLPACLLLGAFSVLGWVLGFLSGMQRGREVERMETPPHGDWHFHDGRIHSVRALSPVAAIDRLIESAGGR